MSEHEVFEAFQGEREVGAAFRAVQGVDLIDDHPSDVSQREAPRGARQQDV